MTGFCVLASYQNLSVLILKCLPIFTSSSTIEMINSSMIIFQPTRKPERNTLRSWLHPPLLALDTCHTTRALPSFQIPFSPPSVCNMAPLVTKLPLVLPPPPMLPPVPLSSTGKRIALSQRQENSFASCSTSKVSASVPITPHIVPTAAPFVVTPVMLHAPACETDLQSILYIHCTPYIALAWSHVLSSCNLSVSFLDLVNDIMFSLPIGNPPLLTSTFIPKNLVSADLYPHLIDNELATETAASRMPGPFTIPQAHTIFHGHFRTSPVGIVEKTPGNGNWRMI